MISRGFLSHLLSVTIAKHGCQELSGRQREGTIMTVRFDW